MTMTTCKRLIILAGLATGLSAIAACGEPSDSDSLRKESKAKKGSPGKAEGPADCPLTGIGCLADCPDSGTINGAPCTRGIYDPTTCACNPIEPDPDPKPEPTCEKAGGTCGALTQSGVLCPDGYHADGDAGTCLLGGGCCMPDPDPKPEPTCEKAGTE